MANEETLIKYRTPEGDRIRVTQYSGKRKGVSIFDEHKQITICEEISRFFPSNEIRIYENGEIIERFPTQTIPSDVLPELGDRLEPLADSGAGTDEIAMFIAALREGLTSQSDRIRDLLNIT